MKKQFKVQSSKFKVQGSIPRNLEPGTWNLERAAAAWTLGALLVAPAMAMAQVMSDPMRPPTGQANNGTEIADDAGGGTVLQSILIAPSMKAAIISGVMVKLGEKYGDAVLVKVTESEVVLKNGEVSQVLKLYPGVDKRDIAPVAAQTSLRKRKSRRSETDSAAPGSPATR